MPFIKYHRPLETSLKPAGLGQVRSDGLMYVWGCSHSSPPSLSPPSARAEVIKMLICLSKAADVEAKRHTLGVSWESCPLCAFVK